MKITYDRRFKKLIIDGENNLIIPLKKGQTCINIDNVEEFNEDTGVRFHVEGFWYKGLNYLTFKEKLRVIIAIIKA